MAVDLATHGVDATEAIGRSLKHNTIESFKVLFRVLAHPSQSTARMKMHTRFDDVVEVRDDFGDDAVQIVDRVPTMLKYGRWAPAGQLLVKYRALVREWELLVGTGGLRSLVIMTPMQ